MELIDEIDSIKILKKIELALRNCYKSENLISEDTSSAEKLIRSCIARGHESPLEHVSITYRVICDRGVSHEWVRSRLASYSQESTRYCNYSKDKFGNSVTFVRPYWWVPNEMAANYENAEKYFEAITELEDAAAHAEGHYFELLRLGAPPEAARAVLPNCVKTDIVVTMNIRELRTFLRLRASKAAHPDIRKLAIELYHKLCDAGLTILFEDLGIE